MKKHKRMQPEMESLMDVEDNDETWDREKQSQSVSQSVSQKESGDQVKPGQTCR